METKDKTTEFTIRRIRPADKEQIVRISSQIWEGSDHVPRVFDQWVADREGEFAGVFFEDRIIGFGKYTYLNKKDVWLEGLRADPQTPHKGIGKSLMRYFLTKLKEKNTGSIRFSTYVDNVQSRSLSEKAGFKPILVLSNKNYEIKDEEFAEISGRLAKKIRKDRPEQSVSLQELCSFLENSQFLKKTKNFIVLGWTCYPYSGSLIKDIYYDPEQFLAVKKNGKITSLILYDTRFSILDSTSVAFFETDDPETGKELFKSLLEESVRHKKRYVEMKIPAEKPYLDLAKSLGMESWEQEEDFYVYEYQGDSAERI